VTAIEFELDRKVEIAESLLIGMHLPYQPVQLYPYKYTLMIKPSQIPEITTK